MAESFLTLSRDEQLEALGVATTGSGRPVYFLEKDVWVVWALQGPFGSTLGEHLVFKGGTSLSKGYDVIQRFSEDIDLTYDIREIIPELAVGDPPSCDVMHAHNPTWRRAISVDKVSWWMGENG